MGKKSESCSHMRESFARFLAINMLIVSFWEVVNARESCLKRWTWIRRRLAMRICTTAVPLVLASTKSIVDAQPLIESANMMDGILAEITFCRKNLSLQRVRGQKSLDDFTIFPEISSRKLYRLVDQNKASEWGPSSILPWAEIDLHPRRWKVVLFPENVILLHK